jgi:serine/threonine protein phosphatase PrpC
MIDFAAITDKGKSRKDNEDFFLTNRNLFIVADGMGGHKAGDVASKLAVQTINKLYRSLKTDADKTKAIEHFFKEANRAVIERAARVSAEHGMGTTLTLMLMEGQIAYFGHIGDSRAYLLRDGELKQLTSDHSLVADMIQEGHITEAEAREHPYRNVITKALGSEKNIKPDIFSIKIKNTDLILICSDGLTSMIDDEEIETHLKSGHIPKEICSALVQRANDKGGVDNITAIIVSFSENKSKNLKLKISAALLAAVLTISAGAGAFSWLINNSYYVGFYKNKVALYRGLPYKLGPWKLSKTAFVSKVNRDKMPALWKQRVQKTFSVENYTDGKTSIKEIEKDSVGKKP